MIRRLLVAAVLFVIIYAIFFGALNALQIIPGPLTQILTPIFSALGSILYFLREFARPNPPLPSGLHSTGHAGAPIWKHTLYYFINFLLVNVLVILPGSTIGIIYYAQTFVCRPSPASNNSIGVGIAQANLVKGIWESAFSGVCIGISNGNFIFDTGPGRLDSDLKRNAANKTKSGDIGNAKPLWEEAIRRDPSDAEAQIYLQDIEVQNEPHITLVVGTMLTGQNYAYARDDLQGAYIAQKEHNDNCVFPCLKLYLLIANSGGEPGDTSIVAQQIVQAARTDPTLVGVMGWPFSTHAISAINVLAQASIPMVSPTASGDSLSNMSPFFFRIAPSNEQEAVIGAQYVQRKPGRHHIAVFLDPYNEYSKNLGEDFMGQFPSQNIVAVEHYTVGSPDSLKAPLQDALTHNPDLIYFSGYARDASTLLSLLPTTGSFANLPMMGGDALYSVHDYNGDIAQNFSRWSFTSFAYPDEWIAQHYQQPAFFDEYRAAFDDHQSHDSPYGYTRADADVMLSYDAIDVFLEAVHIAKVNAGGANASKVNLTPAEVQQGLTQIKGKLAWQGITGQIAFGSNDSDPINKALVVLYVDTNNHIQVYKVYNCFLTSRCD